MRVLNEVLRDSKAVNSSPEIVDLTFRIPDEINIEMKPLCRDAVSVKTAIVLSMATKTWHTNR